MLISGMSKMMEAMAPSSVHILDPVAPRKAEGLAKEVYEQMRADFMVAGPFVLHGEVPELLAAAWVLVRETLFTGEADRGNKEIIAAAVSRSNECPFCVDAHTAAVRATEAEEEDIEKWAAATNKADSAALVDPPFGEHVAEYYGTMVAFHYLNRMVSAFLDEKMMPMPDAFKGVTNSMAKKMMGGMVRKGKESVAGASLGLLPEIDSDVAWRPEWALGSPYVSEAIAGWSSAIEIEARKRLNPPLIELLAAKIDNWQGGIVPPGTIPGDDVTDQRDVSEHGPARLALLAALAPYRVTDADIQGALRTGWMNEDVLTLVAWSAQRAARRCADWSAMHLYSSSWRGHPLMG